MPTHETNTTPKTGLARERTTMPNHTIEQKLSNDDGPQREQSGCMSNGLQPSLCRGSTAASAQGLECPTDGAFTAAAQHCTCRDADRPRNPSPLLASA